LRENLPHSLHLLLIFRNGIRGTESAEPLADPVTQKVDRTAGLYHRLPVGSLQLRTGKTDTVPEAPWETDAHIRKVALNLQIRRKWISLRVSDEGSGFNWRSAKRAPPPGGAGISGWGLSIVALYAHRIRFNRRGNRVALRLKGW
jgi:hypothetical protein